MSRQPREAQRLRAARQERSDCAVRIELTQPFKAGMTGETQQVA
jgi:hypothetical protein